MHTKQAELAYKGPLCARVQESLRILLSEFPEKSKPRARLEAWIAQINTGLADRTLETLDVDVIPAIRAFLQNPSAKNYHEHMQDAIDELVDSRTEFYLSVGFAAAAVTGAVILATVSALSAFLVPALLFGGGAVILFLLSITPITCACIFGNEYEDSLVRESAQSFMESVEDFFGLKSGQDKASVSESPFLPPRTNLFYPTTLLGNPHLDLLLPDVFLPGNAYI